MCPIQISSIPHISPKDCLPPGHLTVGRGYLNQRLERELQVEVEVVRMSRARAS